MKKLRRKPCDGAQCRDSTFFRSPAPASGGDAFFKPTAGGDAPSVQKEDAPVSEEEKKDPVTEGLKTAGEKLAKNESFKKWYEPRLTSLKYTLWDKASPADKAAMISFLGVNAGMAGLAFASNPQLRESLSGVNVGKPLGWIPYSPIEGFTYKLPDPGKTAYGFGADFTFNPFLEALRKGRPGFPVTGATFGLESSYDPAGGGVNLTGGKFGVDLFGGGLKLEGKTFKELSPYPFLNRSDTPGEPASWLMQSVPGVPMIKEPGFQFMLNADLMKMPWFRRMLEGK